MPGRPRRGAPAFPLAWLPAQGDHCVSPALLPGDYQDATVAALRAAKRAGLGGHKDVVVAGIGRDAMRVRAGGKVYQPLAREGINHTRLRPGRIIPRGQVVTLVAGVVPDFVHAAGLRDGGYDGVGRSVD